MPVRHIKREEMLNFDKIQTIAFVGELDQEKYEKEQASKDTPERHRIAHFTPEGVMTAGMILPEYRMRYDGQDVLMVGIGGVASLPEHRHGGAIRACFEYAFASMREKGAVFSSLYPFSHGYYRKFGYELTQPTYTFTLPTEILHPFKHRGTAKMLGPDDDVREYERVFNACYANYNASIIRSGEQWANFLKGDPYKDRAYGYLLSDERGANAYVKLRAERPQGSYEVVAHIQDLAFDGPEAFSGLLGFLGKLSAAYKTLKIVMPMDVPLMSMVEESYDIELSIHNQAMFRVIDVPEALRLMRHPEGARYTIQVRDDGIIENDGVYSVQADASRVSVERLAPGTQADLSLDVRALAPLCLGYLDLRAAAFRKDVSIHANESTLRRVFTRREMFLTDYF